MLGFTYPRPTYDPIRLVIINPIHPYPNPVGITQYMAYRLDLGPNWALGPFGPGSHLGTGPVWSRVPFGPGPIWPGPISFSGPIPKIVCMAYAYPYPYSYANCL